jgi:hypothetical protein
LILPDVQSFLKEINELLIKKISPNLPLDDLLKDSILQSWVNQGILHHKDKRADCAFCRQKLPGDLWNILENHFNKDSEDMKQLIESQIKFLVNKKVIITDFIDFTKDNLYSLYQDDFTDLYLKLEKELELFNQNIIYSSNKLTKRKENIFEEQKYIFFCNNIQFISDIILKINSLIKNNNIKTLNLKKDQEDAQKDLRLNEIQKFIIDIKYDNEVDKIVKLTKIIENIKKYEDFLDLELKNVNVTINKLKTELKDEKK